MQKNPEASYEKQTIEKQIWNPIYCATYTFQPVQIEWNKDFFQKPGKSGEAGDLEAYVNTGSSLYSHLCDIV